MNKLIAASTLILLAACSEPAKPVKKEAPKPELVGAQKAFFQCSAAARRWATDINGFQVQSVDSPALPASEGKYAAWRVMFTAPAKRSRRTYTYSAVEGDGLSKGISQGQEETWLGPTGQNMDWPIQALKIDSDAAVKTAMSQPKAQEYTKKNPSFPITVLLEKTKRFGNPVYRVVWGPSVATSNFSVFIDASTGLFLEIAH